MSGSLRWRILSFLALNLASGKANSQPGSHTWSVDNASPDTLYMGKLKFAKGIYTNWLEIQAGNPSYKENFLADSVSIEQEVLSNGQSGKLILQKTDGQTLPSTIAAVCTGWGIYIRTKVGDKSYGLRRLLNDGPIWFMLAHTHHNGLGNRFNEVGTSIGANGKTVLSNQERHLVEQKPQELLPSTAPHL